MHFLNLCVLCHCFSFILISFVNVYLHKTHNGSNKKLQVFLNFPIKSFSYNYTMEAITVFCCKEKLYEEKASFTKKFHAKRKKVMKIYFFKKRNCIFHEV